MKKFRAQKEASIFSDKKKLQLFKTVCGWIIIHNIRIWTRIQRIQKVLHPDPETKNVTIFKQKFQVRFDFCIALTI
jgi:hypothetical protein